MKLRIPVQACSVLASLIYGYGVWCDVTKEILFQTNDVFFFMTQCKTSIQFLRVSVDT